MSAPHHPRHKALRMAVLAGSVGIALGLTALLWDCGHRRPSREEFLRKLTRDIRSAEPILKDYAADVLSGEIPPGPPSKWYGEPTTLPSTRPSRAATRRMPRGFVDTEAPRHPIMRTDIYPRILTVTKDANGNVYFILSESNVFSNCGFVLRKSGKELLGDGCEPTVRETVHLWGDWWFYRSS